MHTQNLDAVCGFPSLALPLPCPERLWTDDYSRESSLSPLACLRRPPRAIRPSVAAAPGRFNEDIYARQELEQEAAAARARPQHRGHPSRAGLEASERQRLPCLSRASARFQIQASPEARHDRRPAGAPQAERVRSLSQGSPSLLHSFELISSVHYIFFN